MNEPAAPEVSTLSVPLDRDVVLRTLIRELAGTLQDVVGLEEAAGFVGGVGQVVGGRTRARDRGQGGAAGRWANDAPSTVGSRMYKVRLATGEVAATPCGLIAPFCP